MKLNTVLDSKGKDDTLVAGGRRGKKEKAVEEGQQLSRTCQISRGRGKAGFLERVPVRGPARAWRICGRMSAMALG